MNTIEALIENSGKNYFDPPQNSFIVYYVYRLLLTIPRNTFSKFYLGMQSVPDLAI